MKRKVLTSYNEQLRLWVAGESHHVLVNKRVGEECCPDFSCCRPDMLQPIEVRWAFQAADRPGRDRLLMVFLGAAISNYRPTAKVHIVGAEPEEES